jgi:hypothetical protein
MLGRFKTFGVPLFLAMLVTVPAQASEEVWRVSKSTGEVSVTSPAGEQAPLIAGATLKAGDNVRTGANGRALLMRGAETILVSPNSSVGVPQPKKEGVKTTIIQQSGSILLEVEKRNVQHFQVETPYLAAVVKGTQFRVTVDNSESRVDVLRGKVEVADLKTGQYAMVQPGQAAQVSVQKVGLSLSGSGLFGPIQQGTPRASIVTPLPVPQAPPAAQSKPASPQARVASTAADVQWMHGSSQSRSSQDSSWNFGIPGLFGNSKGKQRTTAEDITLSVAVSVMVGLGVAVAVGFQRRRKAKKLEQG